MTVRVFLNRHPPSLRGFCHQCQVTASHPLLLTAVFLDSPQAYHGLLTQLTMAVPNIRFAPDTESYDVGHSTREGAL